MYQFKKTMQVAIKSPGTRPAKHWPLKKINKNL